MSSPNHRKPKRLFVERLEAREVPATFVVTTTADVVDPADHRLSLREAINIPNTIKGADPIVLGRAPIKSTWPKIVNPDRNDGGDFGTFLIRPPSAPGAQDLCRRRNGPESSM